MEANRIPEKSKTVTIFGKMEYSPKMVHSLKSINRFSSNASSKIGDFSELSIEKTRNKKIGYP